MLIHPQFDPVALKLGPLALHWYGLMYLVAFASFFILARMRTQQAGFLPPHVKTPWTSRDVEDMLFFGVLGVVIGGRLGYCFFYKPGYYLANPLDILKVWSGGMAFHGGLLGVIVAEAWFAKSRGRSLLEVADFVAPCVPLGLAAGRMGNFINGELWGRAADATLPWAMVFPQSGTAFARHPSQLYQFLLEGLALFAISWLYGRKARKPGQVAAVFLMGYGVFRFIVEYFREPDSFLGLLALNMSMGQWLCVPMMAFGAGLWVYGQKAR
jgi:phosphatidylglycerol:prolipoprotein diacylglycerol transferase